MPRLRVEGPGNFEQHVALSSGVMRIGSAADCDVRLENDEVDPHHVTISHQPVLQDIGGRNGVFYQGYPVRQHVLQPGDCLALGSSGRIRLTLLRDAADASASAGQGADAEALQKRLAEELQTRERLERRVRQLENKLELQTTLPTEADTAELDELRRLIEEKNTQLRVFRQRIKELEDQGGEHSVRRLAALENEYQTEVELFRQRVHALRSEAARSAEQVAELTAGLAAGEARPTRTELLEEVCRVKNERDEETVALRSRIETLLQEVSDRERDLADERSRASQLEERSAELERRVESLRSLRPVTSAVAAGSLPGSVAEFARATLTDFARRLENTTHMMQREVGGTAPATGRTVTGILERLEGADTPEQREMLRQHLDQMTNRWIKAALLLFRRGYSNWAQEFLRRMSPNAIRERADLGIGRKLLGEEKALWNAYCEWVNDLSHTVLVEELEEQVEVVRATITT